MFTIDERLKGLPVARAQVISLLQSINQPHLAIPGRRAGPATATIAVLRGQAGCAVFVHLYLPESYEAAVYLPKNRALTDDQIPSEEADAIAFVESMGFMMDNMNFQARSVEEQEEMIRTQPVFQKEFRAPPVGQAAPVQKSPATSLGRLLASFALLALAFAGCKHVPTEKDLELAGLHYDLGVQLQTTDAQQSLKEFNSAIELDPNMYQAWNAKGLLLHLSFNRLEEAAEHYKKALELMPTFSDARTNWGNVLLDQKRYDEAIKMYEESLNDMLYRTPFIAQSNLGWAKYKKGELREAINYTKQSLITNPRFCLGYKNLGTIYLETGTTDEACRQFSKYKDNCPETADAYVKESTCLSKLGDKAKALASIDACLTKVTNEASKDDCKRIKEQLKP